MKRNNILALAISASLVFATGAAVAQEGKKKTKAAESSAAQKTEAAIKYPMAARIAPEQKGAPAVDKTRNQMIIAHQKNKDSDALEQAEKILLDSKANNYDKAIATQVKLMTAAKKEPDNHKALIPLLEEIIELNAFDNNVHYDFMSQLAQRYLIEQDYEDALAIADRFIKETKAETETVILVRGNSLYRLKRLPQAIADLEKVRAMNTNNASALQMLARAYADSGQNAKAAEINKGLVQASGTDKASRINLAINYRDTKELDKAADIIADLRAQKQMNEERDYMVALNIYTGMKNREKDTIAMVEEGFASGALKPTANLYNILAEAYYYSDVDNNIKKAIESWSKAAPMAKNGAAYLNLSIVQCQEEMWAACKESAKAAIAKGGINANDAKTQIANADRGMASK